MLLLTRYDRLGASSRLRSLQYIPFLEARGVEVHGSPLLGNDYVRRLHSGAGKPWRGIAAAYASRLWRLLSVRGFDLVWFEKELFPKLPAWAEGILHLAGVPTIVDYDDAVFHLYDHSPNGAVRRLLGGKIDAVMRSATIVIAGNDYLARRALLAGALRVEHLPTVVDLERYPPAYRAWGHIRSREEPFTIGWIGSPATSRHLALVEAPLRELSREKTTRVVVVGAGPLQLAGVRLVLRPWAEATEVEEISASDVGIMPLPDSPFERGKCGYKLIQFMACGLPVVASPVGANREIVDHGATGFLAGNETEWVAALEALRDSPELRARLGAAGRRKVEKRYSLQITAPRLHDLLCQAAAAR